MDEPEFEALVDSMIEKLLDGWGERRSPVATQTRAQRGMAALSLSGNKMANQVVVPRNDVQLLLKKMREIFLSQPMMLELTAPVKIVGDIHGQYSDLIRMFEECGFPATVRYLFLGDYVDRGPHGLESVLLLLCYKAKHRNSFFMLRGNHECAAINRIYGFCDE